jgi:hypothetical protein
MPAHHYFRGPQSIQGMQVASPVVPLANLLNEVYVYNPQNDPERTNGIHPSSGKKILHLTESSPVILTPTAINESTVGDAGAAPTFPLVGGDVL